ncbi:MAG: PH domain-containing protein [Candidatus Hodarchaeales archaeon]
MTVQKENEPRYSFRPLTNFMFKLWLYIGIVWAGVTIVIYLIYFLIESTSEKFNPGSEWVFLLNVLYITLSLLAVIIALVVSFVYTRTMEFHIYANEVVVKKGVVNKTEKHVPFRTITNISSRYGLFDRFFGIGTVEIETAGKSSASASSGPEEKIEGIPNFLEVRDLVLDELRKFRSQYATGTETTEITSSDSNVPGAILDELRAIKKLLANQE